ncbi:hypothetical protein BRADI_4g41965v3 [Brachypodium distachyon]|uniref:KN homeodomain domain-containing protein n=1 Tax=Brachypodium distachyon TaxID=15368 RepID=A0A0Q3EXM0_BRADI|nr:hypothetical protein BRADI_4g41965v3 [Brachypodium distachyon]
MRAKQTGLTRNQVSNWFIKARVRLWKPMVEEMYLEETGNKVAAVAGEEDEDGGNNGVLSAAAVSMVDAGSQQQAHQASFYGEDDAAATSFQQQLKKARTTTRTAPPPAFVHVSGAGHRELLMKRGPGPGLAWSLPPPAGVSLTLGLLRGSGAEQRAASFLMGGSNGGSWAAAAAPPRHDVDLQSSKALAAQLMRDFMA